jgi:hypothetical protein
VEADAEEVAELSPSGVVVSTRSCEEGVPAAGVSPSAVGVEELTARVASCSLSPFCACETYSPRSLRAASIALWLFGDAMGTVIRVSSQWVVEKCVAVAHLFPESSPKPSQLPDDLGNFLIQ